MRFTSFCLLALLLCACACKGPVKVPDFSELHFTGSINVKDLPMPIQGALTHKNGELKYVVAARQGIVLGYGMIDPETGSLNVKFAQSSGVKKLVRLVGEALIELLPAIADKAPTSDHWTLDNESMTYKGPHLDLDARMDNTQ